MSSLPESVGKLTGKVVLVVWGRGNSPESLQKINDELNKREASRIVLENSERLTLSNHPISGFDVVLSNLLDPHPLEHTFELFSEFVRILKPNGKIIGREREDCNADRTLSNLRLAGFVNISGKTDSSEYFSADKPAFEIGASSKLSFGKPAVWSLSNNLVDDDIELVDEDDLLDDDDLLKPNAESLKVCGTTGKRKACKDCSCGLAEELDAENGKTTVSTKSVTSSCGSCYLGDAFRCASCPYLGMPAFKPGEKIQLSERQLNADN